jgi:hypothetical protein
MSLSKGHAFVTGVIEIPSAGHHVMLDQPLALIDAIMAQLVDWDH